MAFCTISPFSSPISVRLAAEISADRARPDDGNVFSHSVSPWSRLGHVALRCGSGVQGLSVRIEDVGRGEIDAQPTPLSDLHRDVGTDAGKDRLLDSRDA